MPAARFSPPMPTQTGAGSDGEDPLLRYSDGLRLLRSRVMIPDLPETTDPPARGLVLSGGTLMTMDQQATVIEATLVVEDGSIRSIDPSSAEPRGTEVDEAGSFTTLDVSDCLVLPGFVQAHLHLGQTIFRGLAEDRRLLPWLEERIWPLEAGHDDESAYWCTLLGAAECLMSGTTTIQDIGIGPGSRGLLHAIQESGLRAFAGHCLMDVLETLPEGLGNTTDSELRRTEELGLEFDRSADGRLRYALNPRFLLSCSDSLWRGVRELSTEHGWPVHTHALEQVEEGEQILKLKGCDEIDYFDQHGILATDLRIAHGVQLKESHLDRLSQHRFSVAHCPSSNLKLGSGIADVVALRHAGIPVGIGADGAPCNNDLDILEEIRLAALLQKLRNGPESFSGLDALRLATSEGARALGLAQEIGSIELGKAADLVVLDTDRPEMWPASWFTAQSSSSQSSSDLGAILSDQVVFAASRASVRHVVVGGELLLEDGQLTHLDLPMIRRRALDELIRLMARTELSS